MTVNELINKLQKLIETDSAVANYPIEFTPHKNERLYIEINVEADKQKDFERTYKILVRDSYYDDR